MRIPWQKLESAGAHKEQRLIEKRSATGYYSQALWPDDRLLSLVARQARKAYSSKYRLLRSSKGALGFEALDILTTLPPVYLVVYHGVRASKGLCLT